jgi:SAM-dependent methyltransferase
MPSQYDDIGVRYNGMKDLPAAAVEIASFRSALGNISGSKALDLACGAGYYTGILLENGAQSVIGYDNSPGMIKAAQAAFEGKSNAEFRLSDCSVRLEVPEGDNYFDVLVAAWFLNYASEEAELLTMCENITRNLKPGGKFIGILPNMKLDLREPLDPRYGLTVRAIKEVRDGWRCRLTAFTEPLVEFEMYHLREHIFMNCFEKAGMKDFKMMPLVIPKEGREEGYWDVYEDRPHLCIFTATV